MGGTWNVEDEGVQEKQEVGGWGRGQEEDGKENGKKLLN